MSSHKSDILSNPQIVTIATFLIGGATTPVDIEDIAMKSNEIAPGRFAWRKYPDQINIFQISNSLSDARKTKNGALLNGSAQKGWMLTANGLDFAKQQESEIKSKTLGRKPQNPRERSWQRAEQIRMLSEPALLKFRIGKSKDITLREAEAFFRLNDYIVGQEREKKIVRFLNVFGDDPLLLEAVKVLSKMVTEKD
jgi:hypothetical protein